MLRTAIWSTKLHSFHVVDSLLLTVFVIHFVGLLSVLLLNVVNSGVVFPGRLPLLHILSGIKCSIPSDFTYSSVRFDTMKT